MTYKKAISNYNEIGTSIAAGDVYKAAGNVTIPASASKTGS
jgi:hypothetical protein